MATITIPKELLEECFRNILNEYGVEDVGTLADIILKADKYRWHDIRKNPDDLPNNKDDEETMCLVKHIELTQDIYGDDFEYYSYSTATYDGDTFIYGNGFSICESKIMNVIAWREIELFGEVE